jgi:OmcA/MtrC family decaheme c-type cytochrome
VGTATCNSCHDALATTFHSADRGGNVVVCRICHEVSNPGAHLEMQSRSIDSYVHAIHSFQAFDISGIDLNDPVAAMEYKSHVNSAYPNGTIMNCQSCHAAGTFDVPVQSKSMPGVLSKSSAFKAGTRNISGIAQAITGPAVRACGSCHKAQAINAKDGLGDSSKLALLNSHFNDFGYQVDASAYSSTTTPTLADLWNSITTKMMAIFK